jgi:pectinesterase
MFLPANTKILHSTGAGAAGTRASFAKKLTSNTGYMAADILGSTWTSWVDAAYV